MSTPRQIIEIYFAILLSLLVLDTAWISLVAFKQFHAAIGGIMRPVPLLAPAVAFYLVYSAGLVKLAVAPALRQQSMLAAAGNGALLGLVAYATFDLTNLSIIQGWTYAIAAIDIAWGAALSSTAAAVGYAVGARRK